MNRREFVHISTLAACSVKTAFALPHGADPEGWRTYEITTSVQIRQNRGATRVWLPAPLSAPTPFQRTLSMSVRCDTGEVRRMEDAGAPMIVAEFRAGAEQAITVTNRVASRDWAVSLDHPGGATLGAERAKQYLAPTRYVPTDGIVKTRAEKITQGATSDIEKARAVYAWIVENTHRNPKVRGCGTGDIRAMLETGDLGGKCADLNGLFVGLMKASGVPARDVYGIRVGSSASSCKSLGVASDTITKAQHCRAEVWLEGFGWVPMDPADVRKVMLDEPAGPLAPDSLKVIETRHRLFGSWEGNWIAYNYAQDVELPSSGGAPLHFFMYPQAETVDGRLDCLAPEDFRYEITAHEITA